MNEYRVVWEDDWNWNRTLTDDEEQKYIELGAEQTKYLLISHSLQTICCVSLLETLEFL